jgi:Fe-S cluster assembly ATPase SufC
LKSLAIAGLSLKTDQPQRMRECLKTIILSKFMQHLDLTDTGLDIESVEELAGVLNSANTLVSIHFSGSI